MGLATINARWKVQNSLAKHLCKHFNVLAGPWLIPCKMGPGVHNKQGGGQKEMKFPKKGGHKKPDLVEKSYLWNLLSPYK